MSIKVDINEVKRYNASLKEYTDISNNLQAEKKYISAEIATGCKELSAELGIEVNMDNIKQIRDDLCAKINSTLQSGNAVLAKIASETQAKSADASGAIGAGPGAGQVYGGITQVPTQAVMEQAVAQQAVAPVPVPQVYIQTAPQAVVQTAPQAVVQPAPANPAAVFQGMEVNGYNGDNELDSFA